jgi:hypothetical protein
MPASQEKIITKLRERREIETDLRRMFTAGSELEFRLEAQRIAALGSEVVPIIVGNLDRADSRMVAAMGAVAALLDGEEMVAALRQAVLRPQTSDQGRLAALTILERYMGLPPDDDLLEALHDPKGAAISSLGEVLHQAERAPTVLAEYVRGLDRQEPDVVLSVCRALRDIGDARAVEPLRAMAQDVRAEIAREALYSLGALRLPEAARALQTLTPAVAPELRPFAERLLRKLRFAGVKVSALPAPEPYWRALISAMDGLGRQSVWFILEKRGTAQARFLNVLISDRAGAVEAAGNSHISVLSLPPRRPAGHVHDIALPDGSGALLMLEATFDLGRRLVVAALAANRETQIPVAGMLRLYSPWLWSVSGAESLPPPSLPDLEGKGQMLVAMSDRLVAHPAFAAWTVRSEGTFQAVEEALRSGDWDLRLLVQRLAGELFAEPVVAKLLARRLVAMSEWLFLAGEEEWARVALATAEAIPNTGPKDLPFVRALIRRDLELLLSSMGQQPEPQFGAEQFQRGV